MNLNAPSANPAPLAFGARFKLASKALNHGLHASKDSAVLVTGGGSLLPSVPMTAAAGMLATDGSAPGASNQFIVGTLNFSNQQAIGQSVAQHHVPAGIVSAALGGSSALGGRKSMHYLANQADQASGKVTDPKVEPEVKKPAAPKVEVAKVEPAPVKNDEAPAPLQDGNLIDTATDLLKDKPAV